MNNEELSNFDKWYESTFNKEYSSEYMICNAAWNAAMEKAAKIIDSYTGCDGIADIVREAIDE